MLNTRVKIRARRCLYNYWLSLTWQYWKPLLSSLFSLSSAIQNKEIFHPCPTFRYSISSFLFTTAKNKPYTVGQPNQYYLLFLNEDANQISFPWWQLIGECWLVRHRNQRSGNSPTFSRSYRHASSWQYQKSFIIHW